LTIAFPISKAGTADLQIFAASAFLELAELQGEYFRPQAGPSGASGKSSTSSRALAASPGGVLIEDGAGGDGGVASERGLEEEGAAHDSGDSEDLMLPESLRTPMELAADEFARTFA
jgi:hypothetical protein